MMAFLVAARFRSAALRSRWATAAKTASKMTSWAMRAAAFSPEQRRSLCGRAEDHVGHRGQRRGGVVGQRDGAGAAPAGKLQGLDDGGGRSRMREADRDVALAQQCGRHQHHVRVVEDAGAHADPQELVADVAGDLRRAADAVEVALARLEDQIGRLLERFRVEDRQRFLEGMDGGAEHLLRDLDAGVVGRQLLMKLGGRQAVVVDDAGAEILEAREAELLGDLDDHGLGHAGIVRHGLQRGGLVEVPAPEHHVDHPPLQGGEVRHHHPDARPHRPRIGQRNVHSRPLVARSISMAARMIRPVASSW